MYQAKRLTQAGGGALGPPAPYRQPKPGTAGAGGGGGGGGGGAGTPGAEGAAAGGGGAAAEPFRPNERVARMMAKMGHAEGKGLGREQQGQVAPVKEGGAGARKRGLGFEGEGEGMAAPLHGLELGGGRRAAAEVVPDTQLLCNDMLLQVCGVGGVRGQGGAACLGGRVCVRMPACRGGAAHICPGSCWSSNARLLGACFV